MRPCAVRIKTMRSGKWVIQIAALFLTACSESVNPANLPKMAAEAGIQISPSARLMYEQHGIADKSAVWIVQSNERFVLPGEKEPTDSTGVRLDLDKYLKPDAVGDLEDGIASEHSWRKDELRYRGTVVHTSKGFFLRLERFAQP
jgi:hypothetical protein